MVYSNFIKSVTPDILCKGDFVLSYTSYKSVYQHQSSIQLCRDNI